MKTPQPTPYTDLNRVLQQLVTGVQDILSDNLVGAYLQGSFAVGDFDLHSDVDFLIATARSLSDAEVHALQPMHERIYNLESHWAQHLEGSYFPRHILQDRAHCGVKLWYLDNGSRELVQSDHCNTVVVRWVVRERGVTLYGPPPETLIDLITVDVLRADILATIRDWGAEILAEPGRFNNRFYQTFIVLSYCRMLHDFHRGAVGSKRAGAAWAKANLDPDWHGLIDRTWDGRPDPAISVRQLANPDDFRATLEFVRVVIEESARFSPEQ